MVVAVVTAPFGFEGARRRGVAARAVSALRAEADVLVVLQNDRVRALASRPRTACIVPCPHDAR